jgi:hypothetical protein
MRVCVCMCVIGSVRLWRFRISKMHGRTRSAYRGADVLSLTYFPKYFAWWWEYITRLASKEIFSPSNKIFREVGRAKDLSAPRYALLFLTCILLNQNRHSLVDPITLIILSEDNRLWISSLTPFCRLQILYKNKKIGIHEHYHIHGFVAVFCAAFILLCP